MTRFLLALRAALASFLATWRGSASAPTPALGPYRKAAEQEPDAPTSHGRGRGRDQLLYDVQEILEKLRKQKAEDAWAEAQRDLTPADMRAAEARRQNVIVEKPLERLAHHRDELARPRAEADVIKKRATYSGSG